MLECEYFCKNKTHTRRKKVFVAITLIHSLIESDGSSKPSKQISFSKLNKPPSLTGLMATRINER